MLTDGWQTHSSHRGRIFEELGGYLAREVWERLLGHPNVQPRDDVRLALLESPDDFEQALAATRQLGPEPLEALESALRDVFIEQDGFERAGKQVFNPAAFVTFFDGFRDAEGTSLLFTLNQDVFLERNYRPSQRLFAPGIGNVAFRADSDPLTDDQWKEVDLDAPVEIAKGEANYIKLHGSFTWRSAQGASLIIAGKDKTDQIRKSVLLSKYLDEFRTACAAGDTWLVAAGYSFGDAHINEAISRGIEHGLRLAILNTQSPTDFRRMVPGIDIWRAIRSYATLPLSEIFGRRHEHGVSIISSAMGRSLQSESP